MLGAFSAYIKNIAVFILFAAFAELIMPENNFKKYISMVMGLLLITAVLKPMLLVFQKGTDLEWQTIQKTVSLWTQQYHIENGIQEQWEHEMIIDIYQKELEQTMPNVQIAFRKEELKNTFHMDTVSVYTEISKQSENYGDVITVNIMGACEKGEEMKQYLKKNYNVEDVIVESGFTNDE